MYTTKKAQEQTLFWWIFGVAVLIVVIIVIQAIGKNLYPSGQQSTACRTTIEAMDKEQGSILSYLVHGTKVPMQCETNWVGNLTIAKKTAEEQKEELLNQIVPLTRECWYEFGEGKLDPFANHLLTNNMYCFICSRFVIDFDRLTNLSGDDYFTLTENDFNDYINSKRFGKNYYSSYFENAFPLNMSFIEKIDVSKIPGFYTERIFYPMDSIVDSERNDYAVVLFAYAPKKVSEAAGISKPQYNVFIMPYKNAGDIGCDELVKKKRTE